MTYHLAIDIGASSGRHILGYIDNGKLKLEEIYRFENYIKDENGTLVWDIKHLVNSVISGIAKCREIGKIPETVAIDTWGVDYVLLDKDKKEILPAVSYRDSRTNAVTDIISQSELYSRTGIQKQSFNTIYQLYCDKLSGKLDNAERFLMIPDYLSIKLTGVIKNEYTNATNNPQRLTPLGIWRAGRDSKGYALLARRLADPIVFGFAAWSTTAAGVQKQGVRQGRK